MKHVHRHLTQHQEDQAKRIKKQQSQGADAQQVQRAMETPTTETLTPNVVNDLHRIHGNQYVSNLTIQPKLTVTPANDKYESEADAMAQQVVARMSDDNIQREEAMEEEELMMQRDDNIQREEAMEEEELMMKAEGDVMGGVTVGDDIESSINAQRGGGSTLPNDLRSGMESGFGADFSGVRLHTDAKADELSGAVQAKAFTTGNDIFFKQGAYNPGSKAGQELLAHELTHTIQQGASKTKQEDTE